jgi:hypothetical protein
MPRSTVRRVAGVTALITLLGGGALSAQGKYDTKVPGGLAFAEFKGYRGGTWSPSARMVRSSPRFSAIRR